jgi:hypothetical protein
VVVVVVVVVVVAVEATVVGLAELVVCAEAKVTEPPSMMRRMQPNAAISTAFA